MYPELGSLGKRYNEGWLQERQGNKIYISVAPDRTARVNGQDARKHREEHGHSLSAQGTEASCNAGAGAGGSAGPHACHSALNLVRSHDFRGRLGLGERE